MRINQNQRSKARRRGGNEEAEAANAAGADLTDLVAGADLLGSARSAASTQRRSPGYRADGDGSGYKPVKAVV